MYFNFDVDEFLPGKITIIETVSGKSDLKIYSVEGKNDYWNYYSSANAPWDIKLRDKKEKLCSVIDEMGRASAKAQSLRTPITTLKKTLSSDQQKLYILKDAESKRSVVGFLKVGVKRLFLCDDLGAHHEVDPLCVLDFYVHESKQRSGFGYELFNSMLKYEDTTPEKLAIDRPSHKFLAFCQKHYNLCNPKMQTNNFVIYDGFFQDREIRRPPIFLYCGKAMQPTAAKFQKKQSKPETNKLEMENLNLIKVPLSPYEIKKNNTFYSSAAKCLIWDNDDCETLSPTRTKKPNLSAKSCSSSFQQLGNNRIPHSSIRYNIPLGSAGSKDRRNRFSEPSSLTPVNVPSYCHRWNELQSSWNVLGVQPLDYSAFQNRN